MISVEWITVTTVQRVNIYWNFVFTVIIAVALTKVNR